MAILLPYLLKRRQGKRKRLLFMIVNNACLTFYLTLFNFFAFVIYYTNNNACFSLNKEFKKNIKKSSPPMRVTEVWFALNPYLPSIRITSLVKLQHHILETLRRNKFLMRLLNFDKPRRKRKQKIKLLRPVHQSNQGRNMLSILTMEKIKKKRALS